MEVTDGFSEVLQVCESRRGAAQLPTRAAQHSPEFVKLLQLCTLLVYNVTCSECMTKYNRTAEIIVLFVADGGAPCGGVTSGGRTSAAVSSGRCVACC